MIYPLHRANGLDDASYYVAILSKRRRLLPELDTSNLLYSTGPKKAPAAPLAAATGIDAPLALSLPPHPLLRWPLTATTALAAPLAATTALAAPLTATTALASPLAAATTLDAPLSGSGSPLDAVPPQLDELSARAVSLATDMLACPLANALRDASNSARFPEQFPTMPPAPQLHSRHVAVAVQTFVRALAASVQRADVCEM